VDLFGRKLLCKNDVSHGTVDDRFASCPDVPKVVNNQHRWQISEAAKNDMSLVALNSINHDGPNVIVTSTICSIICMFTHLSLCLRFSMAGRIAATRKGATAGSCKNFDSNHLFVPN